MTTFREGLRTLSTWIWFFTWVCYQMFFQFIIVTEGLKTLITMICFFKCFFKSPLWEKAFGHWLQEYGFSPECVLKCLFKVPLCDKTFWHKSHENSCYLMWLLEWVSLSLTEINCFSQWWHDLAFFCLIFMSLLLDIHNDVKNAIALYSSIFISE